MSQQSDEAEILALIHANRIALWMRDFEAWSACFVHEPHLVRFGWWTRGGVFHRRGWEESAARLQRDMLEHPDPLPAQAYDTTVEKLSLRIRGDVAWASYEQRYPGNERYPGTDEEAGLSYEFRV